VKPGRYILLGVAVAGAGWFGYSKYAARHHTTFAVAGRDSLPAYDDSAYATHAPPGAHITVEVFNATGRAGLARKATTYLRDRGFDVLYAGSIRDSTQWRDKTTVIDRSGRAEFAAVVAKAMRARTESQRDTTRFIDVSVLVGRDWTPPPLPFYP
jgi:hypothetical protein